MKRTRPSTLPPELHERYMAELEQLLDERDDLDSKTKAVRKLLRGEREIIDDSIARVRLRLKGVDGLQTEIPGTETGERRRSSEVMAILDAAARVGERSAGGGPCAVDGEGAPGLAESGGTIHGFKAPLERSAPKPISHAALDALVGTREEAIERSEKRHHRGPGRPKKSKSAAQDLEES